MPCGEKKGSLLFEFPDYSTPGTANRRLGVNSVKLESQCQRRLNKREP